MNKLKYFVAVVDVPNAVLVKEFPDRNEMLSYVLLLKRTGRERDVLAVWTEPSDGGAK